MLRSWTNRIFGGVCGGFAQTLPLSSTFWRIFFILLTISTLGVGALIYVIWWWLLPQAQPHQRPKRFFMSVPLALIASILLVGLFVHHINTPSPTTWAWMGLIGTLAFTYRQFIGAAHEKQMRLPSLIFPLLPIMSLLGAHDMIPYGINDLLLRSLPIGIIFIGLYIILRYRIPWGGVISLGLSLMFMVIISTIAFSSRSVQYRTDNHVEETLAVGDSVTTLLIDVATLKTDVEFFSSPDNERSIIISFTGSNESLLEHSYALADGGIANYRIIESRPNPYPRLDLIGRGKLRVEVPSHIAVAITYGGQQGTATFDLGTTELERLNMDLASGSALVTLPAYLPLSPSVAQSPGQLAVYNGNLRLVAPDSMGIQFVLNRDRGVRPTFDETRYLLIDDGADGTLQTIGYDTAEQRIRYTITVPNGQIRIDTADTPSATPDTSN